MGHVARGGDSRLVHQALVVEGQAEAQAGAVALGPQGHGGREVADRLLQPRGRQVGQAGAPVFQVGGMD